MVNIIIIDCDDVISTDEQVIHNTCEEIVIRVKTSRSLGVTEFTFPKILTVY